MFPREIRTGKSQLGSDFDLFFLFPTHFLVGYLVIFTLVRIMVCVVWQIFAPPDFAFEAIGITNVTVTTFDPALLTTVRPYYIAGLRCAVLQLCATSLPRPSFCACWTVFQVFSGNECVRVWCFFFQDSCTWQCTQLVQVQRTACRRLCHRLSWTRLHDLRCMLRLLRLLQATASSER